MYQIRLVSINDLKKKRKKKDYFDLDPSEWDYESLMAKSRNDLILLAKQQALQNDSICIAVLQDAENTKYALASKEHKGIPKFILFNAKKSFLGGIRTRTFRINRFRSNWLYQRIKYCKGSILI